MVSVAASSAVADDRSLRILAVGDSLIAGWGLASSEALPARLESALRARGHQLEIINGGLSGDTTSGGLARLDWALFDRPDAVLLGLGANDGLRGIDPRLTRQNLSAMVTRIRARGLPLLLLGMRAPPNLGAEYEAEFNRIYGDLAAEHAVPLYPFLLEGVAAQPQLNQADGIHPNRAGVAVMVEGLLPYLERLVAEAGR